MNGDLNAVTSLGAEGSALTHTSAALSVSSLDISVQEQFHADHKYHLNVPGIPH